MTHQTIEPLLEEAKTIDRLEHVACYFPPTNGRYEVTPGLVRFGTDFGNGELDRQVFQLDENFAHYRRMKQGARKERLGKYFQTNNLTAQVERTIAQFIINRLTQEHPHVFQLKQQRDDLVLHNQMTQEILGFNQDLELQQVEMQQESGDYVSTLDALATQMQEDVTIVSRVKEQHWVSAIHLCFPNHWSAEEKIGREFARVHAPVAGMEAMNRRGDAIVHTMITRPPMVRFAWGLSTDARLNHHPEPPAKISTLTWTGRDFNPASPRLYLRVERQVIWGFPAVEAALFTIRTYFHDCHVVKQNPTHRSQLVAAIRSMSPQSLAYKGLATSHTAILEWLEQE